MTYKYGNWYCKPANESEAREIVERAKASGAKSRSEWAFTAWFYGVYKGEVKTYTMGTKYTIDEVRQKFPLPGEQVNTKWNREGVPPVGTVCEARLRGEWHQCEVLKNKINTAGTKVAACDFGFTLAWCADFRPLRNEREHWVEQSLKVLQEDPCALPSQLMGRIYDALKSGKLKAPEVE